MYSKSNIEFNNKNVYIVDETETDMEELSFISEVSTILNSTGNSSTCTSDHNTIGDTYVDDMHKINSIEMLENETNTLETFIYEYEIPFHSFQAVAEYLYKKSLNG